MKTETQPGEPPAWLVRTLVALIRPSRPMRSVYGAVLLAALGGLLLLVSKYGLSFVLACACFIAAGLILTGAAYSAIAQRLNRNAR